MLCVYRNKPDALSEHTHLVEGSKITLKQLGLGRKVCTQLLFQYVLYAELIGMWHSIGLYEDPLRCAEIW